MFSDTWLYFCWESKPSKTDDNAPTGKFVACFPPPYLRAAQARLASHVTSTFFTRRAACAEQLQFVLISGTKLSPGFLSAEISTINSYRRNNLKECDKCDHKTQPRLSIPPSYLTIYGLDCWLLNPRLFDGKSCGAHWWLSQRQSWWGSLPDIFHVVPIFLK
jgi:hypothetical protein